MKLNWIQDNGRPPAGSSVELGIRSPALVINGPWKSSFATYLRAHGIVEVNVNYAKGFVGDDLGFLTEVPFLQGLTLITPNIRDVGVIHTLHELRALNLGTRDKTPIDFAQFPSLEWCGMEWRPGSESLFGCKTLKRLWLGQYTGKDTDAFTSLAGLEDLALVSSKINDLRGIGAIVSLRVLGLHHLAHLESLNGIEALHYLRELNITYCRKISNIHQVAALENLESFTLADCGEIDSIMPVAALSKLKVLHFYGTTNIMNGNLESLLLLSKLEDVRFQGRRHYNVICDVFPPWNKAT